METYDIKNTPQAIYSEEELKQVSELLDTILSIRQRLFAEGIDVDEKIKELQERDNMLISKQYGTRFKNQIQE